MFRDPTRGGVASTLNEIARDTAKGIELVQTDIPIDNQVSAACEMLGIDPLYVANEGIFIAFVDSEIAEEALALMKNIEYCSYAAIIGHVTADHPGKVLSRSPYGSTRVVNMQVGEQLPRIC